MATGKTAERQAPVVVPPISLGGVLGQDRAVATLRAAMTGGRIHHAWIFAGPAGVGKFTAAVAFAACVMDPTTGPGLTGEVAPDPDSPTQRLIASGGHPDLHIITKELARHSTDKSIRESKQITIAKDVLDEHLLRPIGLAPMMRTGAQVSKAFIVDEAELLDRSPTNAPSQNALLKTLEEPPDGSLIILVTAHEDRLLPTIRSRCQRIGFARLDEPTMRQWLSANAPGRDDAEIRWVLRFADGSPGMARRALDAGLFAWAQTLGPMLDGALAGRYSHEMGPAMAGLIEDYAAARVKENPSASKEAANHAGTRHLLAILADRARADLWRAAGDPKSGGSALAALDAIHRAERNVLSNVPLKDAMEDLSVSFVGCAAAGA